MRTKRENRGSRSVALSFFAGCLFLLFLWNVAGPYGFWKLHRIKEQRKILYAKVIEADRENARLKKELADFKSDRKFQEQIVRQKLGWIKKNEVLYKFIE